jgi:hypothetical protein
MNARPNRLLFTGQPDGNIYLDLPATFRGRMPQLCSVIIDYCDKRAGTL